MTPSAPAPARLQELRNFVNGAFTGAQEGAVSDIVDPSTGEAYAQAPVSGGADVDAALRAAAAAFGTWRYTSRLRSADISRGRAIRGGQLSVLPLLLAFGQPLRVLIATRAGRREQEAAADAYRALQHTTLRVLERAAGTAPRWSWPVLARLCRAARRLGNPAQRLTGNGNRRALIRQHQFLLSAYASLLGGQRPEPGLQQEAESLPAPTAAPTTRPDAAISQPPWPSSPPPEETWPGPTACSKCPVMTTSRDVPTPGPSPRGRHCCVLSSGCSTGCAGNGAALPRVSAGSRAGRRAARPPPLT